MEKPKAKLTRRVCLFVAMLAILLVIVALSRNWLAAIPNAWARESLAHRDEQRALDWLRFSGRLSDRNPETEFLLARTHRRKGEMDLVREHLLRAADLGWPLDELEREQWLALAQSGQMQAAEPHLSELLSDPRGDAAEICEAYVIGAMKMHYLGVAEGLLDVWIKDFPNDPLPYYLRGAMHSDSHRLEKAEADLRRVLEIEPTHSAAALSLAEILSKQGKAEQAMASFQAAELGREERMSALIGQARCQLGLGRPDEARRLLEVALAADKTNAEALVELARLELKEKRYQAAFDRLEPAAQREASNREFRFVLGTALNRLGRSDEARGHLEYSAEAGDQLDRAARLTEQVTSRPRDADLRYRIGKTYLDYGLPKDGLTWLESALQCDPEHKPTHVALAGYYQSKAGQAPTYAELARRHRVLAGD